MRLLAASLLALAAQTAHAAEDRGPLQRTRVPLATLHPELAHRDLDVGVGTLRVYYVASRATPVTQAPAWVKEYDAAGVTAVVPLAFAAHDGIPAATLACDSGGSADPRCMLMRDPDQAGGVIFEAQGTDFVFAADGEIAVHGHTDTMYDMHRIFRWNGTTYAEVRQPLRYVGVEGVARTALALVAARGAWDATPVARVAAGGTVTVLLHAVDGAPAADAGANDAASNDYLLLTRDGITGWAQLPQHPDGSSDVEGLYYRGD